MNHTFDDNSVAIIGFDCLLPGAAGPDELWTMLRAGTDAVVSVPESLFSRRLLFDPKKGVVGRSYTDLAALVDYSTVDRERIAEGLPFLSVSELNKRDPSHVAYAKTVVGAVKSARLDVAEFAKRKTGTYIGHATPSGLGAEYSLGILIPYAADLLRKLPQFRDELRSAGMDADRLADRLISEVRGRSPRRSRDDNPTLGPYGIADLVSSAFHLNGPATVFNSSCASSLQAFAHAVMAIRRGVVDTAIVGGASCFHANTLVLFSLAHSLSATGTAPFAERADGLILGEGYVTVILKRLADALRDGNPVLAVVGGLGISSDGKGKSLWAPLAAGQVECIRRAYPDPAMLERLQYLECHATSTHLGDATEMESFTKVLRESGLEKYRNAKSLPIGSIKRNIGHTLECSGLAGIAKVLLSLRNETIPPCIEPGCELNKDVDWNAIPLCPVDRPLPWKSDGSVPRRAAVESFGIGGLNVHVILDEYLEKNVVRKLAVQAAPRKTEGIAIIGRGTILPGAKTPEEFRALLLSGQEIRSEIPSTRWDAKFFTPASGCGSDWQIAIPPAAIIEGYQYDWKRHKVPPKQLAQASPLQFMFLDAVDQALQNAGYVDAQGKELKTFPRNKTGCIVGTSFGGDFAAQLALVMDAPQIQAFLDENLSRYGIPSERIESIKKQFADKLHERYPALIDETGSFTASSLASRITKSYNLMGGGIAVDAAVGSTGSAIECCTDMLREGSADLMLCLCGEQDMTPERFLVYEIEGELEKPFAGTTPLGRKKTGAVPGEGCVVFLLKRLEDARRDGDTVLGILNEHGTAAFDSHAADAAVSTAWQAASLSGVQKTVAAIEVVGGETLKREKEIVDELHRHYPGRPLDTKIGQFGHLRTAAGAVGLLTALESLADERLSITSDQTIPLTTADPEGRLFMAVHVTGTNNFVQHFLLQRGIPVISTSNFVADPNTTFSDGIVHFDATARRRERLRNQATRKSEDIATVRQNETKTDEPDFVTPTPLPAASAPVVEKKSEPAIEKKLDPAELESFLVNFVVDQTGYPPEIVDLDVDLEADLGIDSIKKAQLFGEIGQYFEVQASDDMTLDQFPTLRSVMNFLLGQGTAKEEPSAPTPPASVPSATTASMVEQTQATQNSVTSSAVEIADTAKKLDPAELESFLVNFVVDQTGYPPEIVDLDVDLEADLGIDSIKKAQLFGEIGQYFEVQASEDMTLDQFPTLRSVMDFLMKA